MTRRRGAGRLARPEAERLGWRRRATRYLFRSPWYDLRQDDLTLPDGRELRYTFVEHPGFVSVVPVLPDGRVLLVRSYRYTVDAWSWEVPAGGLAGRAVLDAARAELREETGFRAERLQEIGRYWSAIGTTDGDGHVVLARDVRPGGAPDLEPTEIIEPRPVPASEALAMARDGRMRDGHSALALLACEPHL